MAHVVNSPSPLASPAAAAAAPGSYDPKNHPYPSYRYHRTKPPVVVNDPTEDAALGEGWQDKPFEDVEAPASGRRGR